MTRAESLRRAGVRLRRDEERWQRAESYQELLRLNVLFLRGRVVAHPGLVVHPEDVLKRSGPILAEETACIVDDLVAMNKLGFFTDCSQPGIYLKCVGRFGRDGRHLQREREGAIEQRAFVSGYAPKALAKRFARISDRNRDLVFIRERVVTPEQIVVTRQGPLHGVLRPFTWIGRAVPMWMLRARGHIGLGALRDLGRCVPLAVYDKKWRRNTDLWPALLAAAMDAG